MKHTKKILILATAFIAVGVSKVLAVNGTVTTDGVRVRKAPSTSSDIVTVLNQSATVEIIEDLGEWYKIKYTWNGNYEGYMSKQFVKKEGEQAVPTPTPVPTPIVESTPEVTPSPVVENTPTQEPEIQPITLGNKVTNNDAKIYLLPTVASTVKDTIKKKTTVTVQEIAGNFVYVKYNNNYGWMRTSVVQEVVQTAPVNEPVTPINTYTERIGYVNVTQAIVREKATTSSNMLSSLNFNAEVTIIGEEEDFYKIRINGQEAYMAKRLISDTKQQTTNRSSAQREVANTVEDVSENISPVENKVETVEENIKNNDVVKSSTGEKIAEMAKSYLGYKYVYGGSSPATGFDCSGLVYYICNQLGYNVNRTADTQINNGVLVEKANLQPGDLVFFSNYKTHTGIGHVGIYIGNNQFVHASTPSTGVITSSLSNADYVKRYVTARRIQ